MIIFIFFIPFRILRFEIKALTTFVGQAVALKVALAEAVSPPCLAAVRSPRALWDHLAAIHCLEKKIRYKQTIK